ncbi:MAG: hypothetical protein AAGG38_03150 [Planctomycetota bacterium]
MPIVGFVLCATAKPWKGNVYIDHTVEPNPPYLDLCREGARITGEAFERCFLNTSWLADGKTPLRHWMTQHPDPEG